MKFCTTVGSAPLDAAAREALEARLAALMGQGLRVLCLAKKTLSKADLPESGAFEGTSADDCNFPFGGFTFVGFIAIEDPPKAGVAEAVSQAHDAGVKVVMVTGDHPDTARAIAARLGITQQESVGRDVVTGADLDAMVLADNFDAKNLTADVRAFWLSCVEETRVFARVSPIHKQVIVEAYQQMGCNGIGDIVAMTGDGVNDAPALKQAHVGIAMGIRGTEVAKDAADIILIDDNFASIIAGMEQGRLASVNLQKSVMYTLCSKIPQVAPTFAELFGVPPALNVAQILLVDIGTDILTAIAYAYQPAEESLMSEKPRHPQRERMVNWKVLVYSYGYLGWLQMAVCWLAFYFSPAAELAGTNPDDWTKEERWGVHEGMGSYYFALVMGQIAAA